MNSGFRDIRLRQNAPDLSYKEEVSALWREGWMPENISGVPAGISIFHLASLL
jgi:hypothetical protein